MKLLLWWVQLLVSLVTPVQQNLSLTSTSIQSFSSESSNKTSRGQTSRKKMDEMLENRRIKEFKENSKRHKSVQIQREKSSPKLAREVGERG